MLFGDSEKEELLRLIKHLSSVYFTEVLGFCVMGSHFHLLAKMESSGNYSNDEVRERFKIYFSNDKARELTEGQIPFYKNKWSNLSEYVKEIKQSFSRYYNKKHKRKGFFWSERFKSVLLEQGETLINCLAYIDLNPVRAGIVERPEDYRWSSLGYHVQSNNKDKFLSLDFGLHMMEGESAKERLRDYREFVYEKGSLKTKGRSISPKIVAKARKADFKLSKMDKFRYRTRYFTDSAIIGSKDFVIESYETYKINIEGLKSKKPNRISGLDGLYSLKRLSEKF